MAPVQQIANFVIEHEVAQGHSLTTYKLHKILFYIQVHSLHLNNEPAFEEEIQAWENGPVVASLFPLHRGSKFLFAPFSNNTTLPENLRALVLQVLLVLGGSTPDSLVYRTHTETPWANAWAAGQNTPITHEQIMSGYLVQEGAIVRKAPDGEAQMKTATSQQFAAAFKHTSKKYSDLFRRLANA